MRMYDCIVVGSGCSGMTAAIAAKRNGLDVLIIEKNSYLGGTNVGSLVGPLMSFHAGKKQVVKGIAQELITKLIDENASIGHIEDPLGFCSTITPVDDEALKNLYYEYIENEKIDLLLNSIVTDCFIENGKIVGIEVTNKSGRQRYDAKVVIDASGDADVAALAKVPYVLGRASDHNSQPMTLIFNLGNVDLDAVRTYMKENPSEFVLGSNYDFKYVGVSGFFSKVNEAKQKNEFNINRDRVLLFQSIRENEVTINMTRVLGYNATDAMSLSKAEVEGRRQLRVVNKFLKEYIPGFKDSYIIKSACQIGVRESRHIVGKYTLNKEDVLEGRKFAHTVAVGSFPIDIHSPTGSNLELFEMENDNSYEIPVEVMIPEQTKGLLVTGRAISATHEASASARVTSTCMALGQAAGTLAALSVKNNVEVDQVDINLLQDTLVKDGQVIYK